MRVLICGCGYVGLPLGSALAKQGHDVFGLTRSEKREAELQRAGIQPLVGALTQPAELERLPCAFDWVVNCAATSGGGPDAYRAVYLNGTRNLIEWLRPRPPQKYVYTSSTSVYAQADGSLVDEASSTEPETETSKVLVETEMLLKKAFREGGFPAVILRVAGIYGPGRVHWLNQMLSGNAVIEGKGDRWLNMIHRDDLVAVIIRTLERGRSGEVYNTVDDEPVRQSDLLEWLAESLGKPGPPFMTEQEPATRKRGATNKRVLNRKLKAELEYCFLHSTFREGYREELARLT